MTLNKQFAQNLKDARLRCDMTQNALANLVGMSPNVIGRMEKSICNPTLKTIQKLAEALNCEVSVTLSHSMAKNITSE